MNFVKSSKVNAMLKVQKADMVKDGTDTFFPLDEV
jgi:hypothetical protein